MPTKENRFLQGRKIAPSPITAGIPITELIDQTFLAYNSGRLREGCQLLVERMLQPNVTVGLSLTGALTPAGLGMAAVIPLMEAGFVDWIVSTGANLYHDTHFGIGLELHQGRHDISDVVLQKEGVVRIYDIFFDYDVLLSTDKFFRQIIEQPEFNGRMGTAEFHYLCGKYIAAREQTLGLENQSLLAAAYRLGVPIYTSSPGDSSIGMNLAALGLQGTGPVIDVSLDVNETAAIVLAAKNNGGASGIWILGGGSPKNFMLQTEPYLQEVLGIDEKGHDYYLQVTDARPDTGGLSGATPSEAVSWCKLDPQKLSETVVVYCDSTIAMPLLTAYCLAKVAPRPLKRLYDQRKALLEQLQEAHLATQAKAVR
ncbi:homospermidine biosynthesis protein [Moorena bouillonii]|uniref:Deoxyhypusine synthase n=1 Tax=Moorena bouillonii PNG TaxID=568701 RepID=A0A1U7MWA5_9CYAN|nr:deoxyhypusine synthase [Moorena bouillonii]OLT57921.1 deoxyhypusine synthase [Moorena bouillonii PNG]